ncbi:hypothetical protein nbrc107696_19400 [Gordonia spumicola]|uniref:Tetratricopeptide repeat protein n=1 Tax=Gordonia spumicola TaxID=589161 RepID=A0A7I9V8D1_9ACTN|nr:hypothetical protein [Gordonia spumicola]GEE01494.1 hypothetical protein nbrc107696_19400 [Gordonia spumicola]
MTPTADDIIDRAVEYLRLSYLDRAREQCLLALSMEPGSVRAIYVLGLIQFRAGEYQQAQATLHMVVAAEPEWVEGLTMYAQACTWAGATMSARHAAETALRLEPDNAEVILTLAETIKSDDPAGAMRLVDQAGALSPEEPDLLRVRALIHRESKRFAAARRDMRQYVADEPGVWQNMYFLAMLEARGLRFRRAIRAVFAAASQFPQSGAQAVGILAFIFVRLILTVQVILFALAVGLIMSADEVVSEPAPVPTIRVPTELLTPPTLPPRPTLVPDLTFPTHPVAPAAFTVADRAGFEPTDGRRTVVDRTLPLWARGGGLLVLVVIAVFVGSTLAAVPRSGWSAVRESIVGFWPVLRIALCAVSFVLLTAAVVGPPIAAGFAVLPLLFGLLSGGKSLLNER